MSEVLKKVYGNSRYFTVDSHTHSFIPLLDPAYDGLIDPDRRRYMLAAGAITAVYIIWNRALPVVASPFFILAVISGWGALEHKELLKHACAGFNESYLSFLNFPRNAPIQIGSPEYFILEPALDGRDIRSLEGPPYHGLERSPGYHKHLCQSILGAHLLGTPRASVFMNHPDVVAFREGFSIQFDNGNTFSDLLAEHAIDLFPAMWCRVPTSPDTLLEHLLVVSANDNQVNLSPEEKVIEQAFRRFLQGVGHPDCHYIEALVGAEEMVKNRNNPVLCTNLFLLAATGESNTPTDPDWQVTLELKHDHGKSIATNAPKDMEWHLCAYSVCLFYDEDMVNACLEPVPAGNTKFSRLIDRWFHTQIIDIKGSSTFTTV
ncbi:interleukin-1 receptor-associated kinase 4 [Ceratobasidium sp. AG-Ba]|nr:interleukin-1 receptor-associated kinase 4 [Ceratobasidium sp. AG-Ba]